MKKAVITILVLLAGLTFLNQAGFCAPTPEQWGVIMNISGRQRMLSQKMSKEALLVAAKINPEENKNKLKDTMKLFETSLQALMEGNAAMNIPVCELPEILEQLEKVQTLYADLNVIFAKMVEGEVADIVEMQQIAKASLPLLTAADKAVQMFGEEAKKVLVKDPSLATAINIAGRQRMLSQKMAKEALLLHLKVDMDAQIQALSKTVALFDKSLKGLKFGDNEMGLPPLKQDDISAQLDIVESSWLALKPAADKIASSALQYPITKDEITSVCGLTDTILAESNKAVGMFEKLAQ